MLAFAIMDQKIYYIMQYVIVSQDFHAVLAHTLQLYAKLCSKLCKRVHKGIKWIANDFGCTKTNWVTHDYDFYLGLYLMRLHY